MNPLQLPAFAGATPWSALERLPQRPQEFSFVLLSDRTGLPKPGVFERAVQATNLLRPDFAIQIGDSIEGYTRNPEQLAKEWAEFDAITDELEVPLFRVPGNHDVSNPVMQQEWLRRFGALHYHFVYRDVLFLVLNTQDPPHRASDFAGVDKPMASEEQERDLDLGKLQREHAADPRAFAERIERAMDNEGRQPAHLSAEQAEWAAGVVREHADVRWTVILMHIPAWQGGLHPSLAKIRNALAGRRYTAFAGHLHNYRRCVIDGNDHVRLGPSGGCWVTTREEGNFDHVTWVTMTAQGPRIANFVLDGIFGIDGGTFRPAPMFR
ncbi:MAG: metallophosphoesterase family protein [Panacagrimonas sp.]